MSDNNRERRIGTAAAGREHARPQPRRLLRVALVFVVVTAVCGFLDLTGGWGFDWLELYAYKMRMVMYAQRNSSGKVGQQIVLVTLSDDTFDPNNASSLPGPPVPRDYHAKIIRDLTEAGAKVIAYDLVFDTPRPAQDAKMAAAARGSDKVLWAAFLDNTPRLILPNKTLLKASGNYAHINVPHDPERPAVDHIQAFVRHGNTPVPAFSLKIALISMGLGDQPIRKVAGRWQAGDFIIPVDDQGNYQISYLGKPNDVFAVVPYEALYNPGESKSFYREFFRNKIVLIGDTTKVGNDLLYTPVGNMWGVETHAHAVATLLRGQFVRAAPAWVNLVSLGLLVALACLLAALRRVQGVVLGAAFLLGGYFTCNAYLFIDHGLSLHLIGPMAALLLATLGVLIERSLSEEHERERMFESLVMAAASAIEARDPSTAGHSQRVTTLTIGLARAISEASTGPFRQVRFTATQMRELRYATMLHDFGKIGVRESILTKSHKLESMHFQTVKDRLLLLRCARENVYAQKKVAALLEQPREQALRIIEELDDSLRAELADLDACMMLLEDANNPLATYLPDNKYAELQEILNRLVQLTYQDETGATQPLLTQQEKEALSVRKGSLTPDEYQQVKDHARMSYNFLQQIPWTHELKNIPNIAHCHHEKLNGSGYPRGIEASEIPLQARIMTIADIYDALTAADRPYKKAMPAEKALQILRSEACDGCLDNDLVDVFISNEVYKLTQDRSYSPSDEGLAQSPAKQEVQLLAAHYQTN